VLHGWRGGVDDPEKAASLERTLDKLRDKLLVESNRVG
jgi:hypothetical protein